jgi:hypothetical protein
VSAVPSGPSWTLPPTIPIKKIKGINEFKKGYQPRSNLLKDENGYLLADPHNILNRWKNYFSQSLNVHRVSDIRQIEVHTAEPLVPEVEIAAAK